MNWEDFRRSDPELAALGEERFDATGLIMIGTIRKNGWPRISAVEPLIFEGKLYLGMMWQSLKALDLLRDPRCSLPIDTEMLAFSRSNSASARTPGDVPLGRYGRPDPKARIPGFGAAQPSS